MLQIKARAARLAFAALAAVSFTNVAVSSNAVAAESATSIAAEAAPNAAETGKSAELQSASTKAATSPKSAKTAANSKFAFKTFVGNVGGQDAVDACTGGLTKMPEVGNYLTQIDGKSKTYLPIHNECGGRPILTLEEGQKVMIDGMGKYQVVATRDIVRGDKASALAGLPGTVLIQTCFDTGNQMRVVALMKIA